MSELFWYAKVHSLVEHVSVATFALFSCFLLYQFDYAFVFARYLLTIVKHGSSRPPRADAELPPALVILPTLLRTDDELVGLMGAMQSAAENRYAGPIYIVAAIDDGAHSGELYTRLSAWLEAFPKTPRVHMFATKTNERSGKALAIEAGIQFVHGKVAAGEIPAFPTIFFNMDADGRLGPEALSRMADRLLVRSWLTGERPMMVASNVCIAPDVFWGGWRQFFTTKGQLALLVSAEYMTAIAIGKMNGRLIPVTNASGALYCTWSSLHLMAPRWASFMQSLTLKSWLSWWLGVAPPRFLDHHGENPDAQTGPGDDTWMTWLCLSARWKDEEIVVDLPRTPVHALWYMVRSYFVRPLAYTIHARIETKTPTTVKALFKQRVRWNSSRIQDVQRWRPALMYHWSAGLPVIVSTALMLYVHTGLVLSLIVWPFASRHGAFAVFVAAYVLNLSIRLFSTVFALLVDGSRPKSGFKILALAMWIPYNFVFNTLTTVWGSFLDVFGFGVNTKFSPETTHIKSGLSRIALAYRCRRALALSVRAIIHNDVPLGTFWFGWHETPWTPNGFEGWSTGVSRALYPRRTTQVTQPKPAESVVAPVEAAVKSLETTAVLTPVLAEPDVLRDSVRIRHVAAANMVEPAARISIGNIAVIEVTPAANSVEPRAERTSLPSIPPPAGTKKRRAA